jgi:putative phosphoesterase
MSEEGVGINSTRKITRKVAILSDIHGNLQALNAVLDEIDREHPDFIIVCGDVATGPFPGETMQRLMDYNGRAHFIRGNADRELLSAFEKQAQDQNTEKDSSPSIAVWCAQRINPEKRDFMAEFQEHFLLDISGIGRAFFCHGSPRSDEEIITSLTPDDDLRRMLTGVQAEFVFCGHTHHQFDREVDGYRVVNVGSLGMPYEGKPGAFWVLLDGEVHQRATWYNFERAVDEALSIGYPDPSYPRIITNPPEPAEAAAFFEKVAVERGQRR